jgi:hypothetical protein
MADVTLFRHAAPHWPGGSGVHVLESREGFMLISPSPCHNVLAAILAETATVDSHRLTRLDRGVLINRGYCRHCVDSLRAKGRGSPPRQVRHDLSESGPVDSTL